MQEKMPIVFNASSTIAKEIQTDKIMSRPVYIEFSMGVALNL